MWKKFKVPVHSFPFAGNCRKWRIFFHFGFRQFPAPEIDGNVSWNAGNFRQCTQNIWNYVFCHFLLEIRIKRRWADINPFFILSEAKQNILYTDICSTQSYIWTQVIMASRFVNKIFSHSWMADRPKFKVELHGR